MSSKPLQESETPQIPPGDRPFSNVREYTVSELSYALKRTVEETYEFVRVRGEISGLKRAASGHVYLCLKDTDAVLDAVCWKGTAVRLPVKPQDGLEVVATGKLTTFPGRSKYQLVVQSMELAGVGALMALLEERRKALAAEGLFDPARKKPLPFLPKVIGVVTSPTGAVIRDILHRLSDRFPREVIVWPVLVQGEGAAAQVASAIRGFNALPEGGPVPRPDLLIVARGGGSLEDLWAFNEEIVVRAAAASEIPLISAVGHETDTTLIDFAADLRAPTPTAAAEKAVPVRADLLAAVAGFARRLDHMRRRMIDDRRDRLRGLVRGLPQPRDILMLPRQRLDVCSDRLPRALVAAVERREARLQTLAARLTPHILKERTDRLRIRMGDLGGRMGRALATEMRDRQGRISALSRHLRPEILQREVAREREKLHIVATRLERSGLVSLQSARQELAAKARLLDSLGYDQVLKRGFALVRDANGRPLVRAAGIRPGAHLEIEWADGRLTARAAGTPGPQASGSAKPAASSEAQDRQGKLL